MKKRVLALLLAAAFVLSACSNTTEKPAEQQPAEQKPAEQQPAEQKPAEKTPATTPAAEPVKDLVLTRLATQEIATFNILYSGDYADFYYLTNMIDNLVEVDTKGQVVPALAESWETTDNGKTWTFHLRQGVKWVDVNGNEKGEVTARDWMTAMEWVMNYYKNESSHTSQPSDMIAGAKEYYEWTKTLSQEEAYALDASEGSKFDEMVGVDAPDDYTLVYTCPTEKPYFASFPAWAGLYPMAQGLIDELGVDGVKSMDNTNYWYNGCYLMTEYIANNEKVFTPNPLYWDTDCTRFDSVTIKMVESGDVAYQLYENGEIDYVALSESNLQTITSDPNHKYADYLVEQPAALYSYQYHFNFNKNNEDGTPDVNYNTAIANTAFRQSIRYGLDLKEYYGRTNSINPMSCENEFYTMKGLIYNSKGEDYTELVRQELGMRELDGETIARLDKEKFESLKAQAMEELSAKGVTFPVHFAYYISGSNQAALDSANVLKQAFTDSLGDDYIVLDIKTYVSSFAQEVRTPRLQSFSSNGWGADYGDPVNYLGQEISGTDSALYARSYSNINSLEPNENNADLLAIYEEFNRLVAEADAINDDSDARLAAFAKAEAYMLENVITLPANYGVSWCLTKIDPYSKQYAIFGCQNDKMKNWVTNANGFTTAEIEASKAANN